MEAKLADEEAEDVHAEALVEEGLCMVRPHLDAALLTHHQIRGCGRTKVIAR